MIIHFREKKWSAGEEEKEDDDLTLAAEVKGKRKHKESKTINHHTNWDVRVFPLFFVQKVFVFSSQFNFVYEHRNGNRLNYLISTGVHNLVINRKLNRN